MKKRATNLALNQTPAAAGLVDSKAIRFADEVQVEGTNSSPRSDSEESLTARGPPGSKPNKSSLV